MTAFREKYNDPEWRAKLAASNLDHLRRVLTGMPPDAHGLEIGCFEGGTTKWLLENFMARMTVIDTFEGSLEHGTEANDLLKRFSANIRSFRHRITIVKGRSDWAIPALLSSSEDFDFVYVDASHDSRDVIVDATLGFKLLKPGGIMVLDDYEWAYYDDPWRNPTIAIDFFLGAFAPDLEVLEKGYQVSIRKLVKRGDKPRIAMKS